MHYQQALEFLRELTKFGFNFGLERIQRLLFLLGNPQDKFKTVHVAGTNGKGSVCAFTSNILSSAGYKTGLFTSPHLHSYTERIKIDGKNIAQEVVGDYLSEIKPLLLQMVEEGYEHPTEFEVTTALAFKYFADKHVDFAVIEVGLGGAIDSTNVILPEVTAITNVSFDHMDYLGNTIEEIAAVKAGIIKNGVSCVTAAEGIALEVITKVCKEKQAPLQVAGIEILFDESISTKLLGEHQKLNIEVVQGIVRILREKGFNISDVALKQGFSQTEWPGRLEVISDNPLVIIDAAHNSAGAQALAKALPNLLSQKAVFVLGILADKERHKMLDQLIPFMEKAIVTKPNTPRAGAWQEVYHGIKEKNIPVFMEENIVEAVKKALSYNSPVVITGSIYMIAEARAFLLNIPQE